MKEVCKVISEFPNYEVSTSGNIYSLNYFGHVGKRGKLKPKKNKHGYMCVVLYKNKIKKDMTIHRLVALTFITNPANKPDVNHKDCNKENNKSTNLEWCTKSENMIHARDNNLCSKRCKINMKIANKIREEYSNGGIFQRQLAEKYDLSFWTIHEIISYRRWKPSK